MRHRTGTASSEMKQVLDVPAPFDSLCPSTMRSARNDYIAPCQARAISCRVVAVGQRRFSFVLFGSNGRLCEGVSAKRGNVKTSVHRIVIVHPLIFIIEMTSIGGLLRSIFELSWNR